METQEFLKTYEAYLQEYNDLTNEAIRKRLELEEKYKDFTDLLDAKVMLKLSESFNEDITALEDWLTEKMESPDVKKFETDNGAMFEADRDDLPDNMYLLNLSEEDEFEFDIEPVNNEIIKVTYYFEKTKCSDEKFYRIADISKIKADLPE